MKRKWVDCLVILGLLAGLSACQSARDLPRETGTPAATVGQVDPTDPPIPAPSETALAPAPLSSATPTVKPRATDTAAAPTETPSPTADLAATVVAAGPPQMKESSTSPDGRWRAEAVRYECVWTSEEQETAFESLRLVELDTGEETVIAGQLQNCGGLGAAGFGQISWSEAGRFLYFSDAAEGVPDGGCGYWQRPLTAYDLESGETFDLAQGPRSPDRKMIAFWELDRQRMESAIVIWDLENGETGRFAAVEPAWYGGSIAWSPGGKMLAYIRTQDYCMPWGETIAILIDLSSGEETVVVRSEDPGFVGLEWSDPERITLFDEKDQAWMYDLGTGELTQQP